MNLTIDKFHDCHILVVGDLMIDEYIWGEVDRISPEAPVPIVLVKDKNHTLGGSGNVVNNLVALGAKVSVIGVIGTGENGEQLLALLKDLGVDAEGVVQESERPTTKKTRVITSHQHVLRIDWETRRKISDKSHRFLVDQIEKIIPKVDVVLLSDYGKGLITSAFLKRVVDISKAHKKFTIADPKGFNFDKYAGVSLLTPNKKEAALAAGVEILDQPTLIKAGVQILNTADVKRLLITCGKDGMVLFEGDQKPRTIQTDARQVYDVSGAGDTVLAVVGIALAAGLSLIDSIYLANIAAGIVVGKVGTATVSKEELALAIKTHPKMDT